MNIAVFIINRGKNIQKYLGGLKEECTKNLSKNHDVNPNPKNIPETKSKDLEQPVNGNNAQPAKTEQVKEPTVNNNETVAQTGEQPVKVEQPIQTYTTKLADTVKTYTPEDLDIYGFMYGKPVFVSGKTQPVLDLLKKVRNRELTVLYDETNKTTEIILPFGRDFFGVKINGIVSQDRAKDIFRTINANGILDPKKFPQIITDVLNGKLNTKYSLKNIGISYDFHDKGHSEFRGGGGIYAPDGRILLRDYIKKWEGYIIGYYAPTNRMTKTEIAVALPSFGRERACSNNYDIVVNGLIPSGTVNRLMQHLEKDIIKNPKDPKYEELAKIQEATLKFLNEN